MSDLHGYIDLRSDTVTRPTKEMLDAMYQAVVGDDVYGDDPTVRKLQAKVAELMGKEAALFVPTGTFGNQLCVLTHTNRGDEVLLPESNHILQHEVGAASIIAGVQLRTLDSQDGTIHIPELLRKIRENDIHYPRTGLICMENAHSSGRIVSLENMRLTYDVARKHKIPVHLDGARIFNAAIALGVEAKEIAQYADSIMCCISKGLCAPIGSLVLGSEEFIQRALKNRKMMGGGMRQVGYLAAAALVNLEKMIARLGEDHENARYLAHCLEQIPGIRVCQDQLDINMVFFYLDLPRFNVSSVQEFVEKLKTQKILINGPENNQFRLVTHYWINRQDIEKTYKVFASLCGGFVTNFP
ncbi:MAG: low-specificity L-threonine aldolase [Candidatus Brocadiae bacterium]|nr:low-specificity L-threonine aldolase [Candidatus Brocadiia bacterium]